MSELADRFAAVTAERFAAPLESGCTELGFEIIYSRHRADNNAVLVPKLKRGSGSTARATLPSSSAVG